MGDQKADKILLLTIFKVVSQNSVQMGFAINRAVAGMHLACSLPRATVNVKTM